MGGGGFPKLNSDLDFYWRAWVLRGPWDRTGVGISDATKDSLGDTPEEMEASKAKGGVIYTNAATRCPQHDKA